MLADFAAWFLVASTVATALFQVAIVLGAPLGEYSYGGTNPGVLSARFRVASVFSALLMLGISGHYLAQIGVFSPILAEPGNSIVNWFLVGFFALAAILNNITKSEKEKRVFGSVTLAMLLASVIVAI